MCEYYNLQCTQSISSLILLSSTNTLGMAKFVVEVSFHPTHEHMNEVSASAVYLIRPATTKFSPHSLHFTYEGIANSDGTQFSHQISAMGNMNEARDDHIMNAFES